MPNSLLLVALALWTPAGGGCPDQIAVQRKAEVRSFFLQNCGAGLDTSFHGVRIRTAGNTCPLVVLVTPAYRASQRSPGSGTETYPVATLPVWRLDFQCTKHWFLGIIPIPIGSSCQKTSEKRAGAVTDHGQRPCSFGEAAESEETSGR